MAHTSAPYRLMVVATLIRAQVARERDAGRPMTRAAFVERYGESLWQFVALASSLDLAPCDLLSDESRAAAPLLGCPQVPEFDAPRIEAAHRAFAQLWQRLGEPIVRVAPSTLASAMR